MVDKDGDNDNRKLSIFKLYKIISLHVGNKNCVKINLLVFLVSAADKNSARRLWVRDCVKIISLAAILLVSTRASPTSRVMKKLNLEKGHL